MDIIVGATPQMQSVAGTVDRVAASNIPVLIQGESGTGKEIISKLIHIRSDRATAPWIKVICPAIPASLIESELFGYERGAFTGAYTNKCGRVESAHRGTLFLDEIGSLEVTLQAKLLQVLQDGSFTRVGGSDPRRIDARIVSSANRDLRKQTEDGEFRLDFLSRINAVTITLPPLRDRAVDVPAMVGYFLGLYSRQFHTAPRRLSNGIRRMLQEYDWPGNIRQLENLIRNYALMGSEEAVASELVHSGGTEPKLEIDLAQPLSLKELTRTATKDLERRVIMQVLQANGWSRKKTARWLNISYRSLLYKLEGSHAMKSTRLSRKPEGE
jgi:two-component system response regulator AtoC